VEMKRLVRTSAQIERGGGKNEQKLPSQCTHLIRAKLRQSSARAFCFSELILSFVECNDGNDDSDDDSDDDNDDDGDGDGDDDDNGDDNDGRQTVRQTDRQTVRQTGQTGQTGQQQLTAARSALATYGWGDHFYLYMLNFL